jgi:hypothetical protein
MVHLKNANSGKLEARRFCAREMASHLAERAKLAGGGGQFSVCSIFAMKEFEAWLIAGVESLSNARVGTLNARVVPPKNIEDIRGAKAWLSKRMQLKYKPSIHQLPMSEAVDLTEIRAQNLRSFRRLEKAIDELVTA